MPRVAIGVVGWDFPAWSKTYYPEDIPEDWKLAFYANDFAAVVLPESVWGGDAVEALEETVQDLDEGFRFYCLAQSRWPSGEELSSVKRVLKSHLQGFLVERTAPPEDLQLVEPELAIVPADMNLKADLQVKFWAEITDTTDKPLHVIRLTDDNDLKTLRQQFDKVRQQLVSDDDIMILVSSAEPESAPDIEFLQQLRTLLELMSIA